MIKSVTVTNHLGESRLFVLAKPDLVNITNMEGIGSGTATINTTKLATRDGSKLNSTTANERNIVLTLKLMFAPTVEDSRLATYKYFPRKQRVKLLIETDRRLAYSYGYVESNEPNIFSKEEESQISIICPDPNFYSEDDQVTIFYGVEPLFEFIFSNESLTDPLLIMGEIHRYTEQNVYYEGDSEVGVLIWMHAIGDVRGTITIYNSGTREQFVLNTATLTKESGDWMKPGDDIEICTEKGNHYVRLLRAGVYYNILNSVDRYSDWFQLSKGDNIFAFVCDEGNDNLHFRIENKIAYEGM